jgi:hypothetical protein
MIVESAVTPPESSSMRRAADSNGGSAVAIGLILFALLSIAAAIESDGFLTADGAAHYAYARQALHSLASLTNVWAKPLTTALFMVPAAVAGRLGVRMVSLGCALICAITAWRIAILQRYRWPALAAIFTLGQPLLFIYSFGEMTELPFAATAGLAFLAYRKRQWWLCALLGSLLPLGRPEGFGACLLIAIGLIFAQGRSLRAILLLLLLPIPLMIWDYAGWIAGYRDGAWWLWIFHNWPYASGSDYPSGPLLHFLLELPVLVSPVALPAVFIGIGSGLKKRLFGADHLARCQGLIAFIPGVVLVVHSLLYWLGRFSSDGELRYLLIASPFWGLLAAGGWEKMLAGFSRRKATAFASIGLLLPALIDLKIPIVPQHMSPDWVSAKRLLSWYVAGPLRRDYPRLIFSHPAFDYYLNAAADDPIRATPCCKKSVAERPPGFLLIWDEDFSTRNADPSRDVLLADFASAGWTEIAVPPGIGWKWHLFLSRPEPGK